MTEGEKVILIVDDDRDFVESLSSYLEANGYGVLRAHDGREGLRVAKMARPDLIIMDIVMDERTEGFFAVQELRHTAELRHIPILVVTSLYSSVDDFKVSPDQGWLAHDALFLKPPDLRALLRSIRQYLRWGKAESAEPERTTEP